jgi:hypothetical protein
MGQCKSGGKDFKSGYSKEKLRKNLGQCKYKERAFKDRKEDFRRIEIKKTLEERF